jgi:uncharacterized lipoprotein NlpE involved in copper resistance
MDRPLDDELLERLQPGIAATTVWLASDTGSDIHAVANRLQLLAGYRLVRPVGDEFVTLTVHGKRYLRGVLDAAELAPDE